MTGFLNEREFGRRSFLKGGGALIVSFSMFGALNAGKAAAATGPYPLVDPGQLDSWLKVDAQGNITAFTGRVDQGQGKKTSYAQVVAEELDVPVSRVTVVLGDTERGPNQGKSTATNGVTTGMPPLRNAAAQARAALLGLASTQLGVPAGQLSVADGVIGGAGKSVSYASLVGGKQFNVTMATTGTSAGSAYPGFPYATYSGATTSLNVVPTVPVKDPSTYKIVGTRLPRVDIPDKVTGRYVYLQNLRLPHMLHARVILPPRVASYPAVMPTLLAVKGFKSPQKGIQIVRKGNFLAVVAEEEWRAIEAASELLTEWSTDPNLPNLGNVFDVMRNTPNSHFTPTDSVKVTGAGYTGTDGRAVSARYDFPFTTHGMIGPSCGLASWDKASQTMTLFTGMQNPPQVRADVATLLDLDLTQVRSLWYEQSSMFGRGGVDDAVPAAALLSMQLDRPVRVQWMRADEHVWGPHMPGLTHELKATIASNGTINSWYAEGWQPAAGWDIGYDLTSILVGKANGLPHGTGGVAAPGSVYTIPNVTTIGHTTDPTVRPMYMRTVAGIQTTFMTESFMDELAATAGVDAIQFRLDHMTNQSNFLTTTGVAVLQAVQKMSGWQTRTSPAPKQTGSILKGRGVCLSPSSSCTIAHLVEVEVNRKTGNVYVPRIFVAAQLGSLVNPDQVEAQIQGGTLMGLSRAIKDGVTFGKNQITSADWVTYPIVRFMDIPESIDFQILNPKPSDNGVSGSPWTAVPNGGIGEPSSIGVPAAVGNAIFDATGVRIRRPPFRPAPVLAALKAAGIA